MRRIRARRRLRAAIILPASLCLVLFMESRIEAFVPQLKNMAVANTERMFDGKLGIAVGSLDGGIIRPITLNDVRIKNTGQTSAFPSFVVSSIKTNYRIWDIVLRFGGGSGMKGLLSSGSSVSVIFSSPDAKISGIASIESALSGQKVSGRIGFSDDKRVEFSES